MTKVSPRIIQAALLALGAFLGTGGTIVATQATKSPVEAVKPQIKCPDVILYGERLRR